MQPDITHISQSPLSRMFVGTHDETNPTAEHWFETGNFLRGVTFKARKLRQKDGKLRNRAAGLGMSIEGNAAPAENHVSDYLFYRDKLNGIRNVCFLLSDVTDETQGQMWFARLRKLDDGTWQDNRISIITDAEYEGMGKNAAEFSGWVADIEIIQVKNLKIAGDKLQYVPVASTLLSALATAQAVLTGGK